MKQMKKTLLRVVLILCMMLLPVSETGIVTTAHTEQVVYVTRTGSKYHTHKCGNGTYYQASLSQAKARGLTPCMKCFGSSTGGSSSNSGGESSSTKSKPKLTLSSSSLMLVGGKSKTLKVKNASGTVKWTSSNAKVASVSGGKITAKGKGKATITASCGGVKKSCTVKVETPKMSRSKVSLTPEDTMMLRLGGCSHEVSWSSSNEDVCEVYDGEIEAIAPGTAMIKAKVHGMVYKCKVVVRIPQVRDFSLSAEQLSLDTSWNDYEYLYISGVADELYEYYQPKVTSADAAVATVVSYGDDEIMIQAVGEGETDITVQIGKVAKTCHVVVTIPATVEDFAEEYSGTIE